MKFRDYRDLVKLAKEKGFHVTSTTGGKHNPGSRHGRGLAIDVRTRDKSNAQCVEFLNYCRSFGLVALDERTRPPGQKVWGGAHIHVHIPDNLITADDSGSLSFGSRGDEVKKLQTRLVELGLLPGKYVTGNFLRNTDRAVKKFQQEKGLVADGVVGPKTSAALF
jgi:hypothetical protein